MSRALIIKLAAVATASTATFGMAATLGVAGPSLGAGSGSIASCDTDGVTTANAPLWDATDGRYEVASVTVNGISVACAGKSLRVTLTNGSGASIGEITGTVAATSETLNLSTALSAAAVEGVHVTIAD